VIADVAQNVAENHYNSERISRIAHQLWAPENNYFSSRMERKTASAEAGRPYFENGAWQAWLFDLV